jgi:hypothetical protein
VARLPAHAPPARPPPPPPTQALPRWPPQGGDGEPHAHPQQPFQQRPPPQPRRHGARGGAHLDPWQPPWAASGSRAVLWPSAVAQAEGAAPAPGAVLSPAAAPPGGADSSPLAFVGPPPGGPAPAARQPQAPLQPQALLQPDAAAPPPPEPEAPAAAVAAAAAARAAAEAAAAAAAAAAAGGPAPQGAPSDEVRWKQVMALITRHCLNARHLAEAVSEPRNAAVMGAAHYAAALHRLAGFTEAAVTAPPAGGDAGGSGGAAVAAAPAAQLAAGKQQQRPARLASQLLSGFQHRMGGASARDLADAGSAAAKLSAVPRRAWARAWRGAAAAHVADGDAGPREMLRMLWAAARLHRLEEGVLATAQRQQQRQALRGGGGGSSSAARAPPPLAPAWAPRPAWLAQLAGALLPALPRLDAYDLSLAAWAFGALGYNPGAAWWAAFLPAAEAAVHEGRCSPTQLSMTAWALARLGVGPGASIDGADAPSSGGASSSRRSGGTGSGGGGGGSAGADAWWQAFLSATEPLLRTPGALSPQALSNMAWALAKARVAPPPAWVDGFMAASSADLGSFSAQHLANTLWALAALSQQQARGGAAEAPAQPANGGDGEAARARRLGEKRQRAAQLRGSPAADALAPSAKWMERFWRQLVCVEAELEPRALSSILWALAVMGMRPSPRWAARVGPCTALLACSLHGPAWGGMWPRRARMA